MIIGIEEVWNKFLLSPLEFARYIDEFESPWVRPISTSATSPSTATRRIGSGVLGKRIVKLHIKDFKFEKNVASWVNLKEGQIDWHAVHAALEEIKYKGSASVELSGGDGEYLKEVNRRFEQIFERRINSMKRFALGFVIGLLFAGLVLLIIGAAAMRFGTDRPPAVADGSTLVLHLEGELPEQPQVTLPIPFLEDQQPMTMVETWHLLRKAAADSRIKALVLEPRALNVGWAKLEELRGSILAFKKTGKPVYAYLRGAGTKEYYIATAADKVFMAPEEELDVKGLRAELMFFKGTLDKLGVGLEFEHVGKYKDAPDMYTRTTPTPRKRWRWRTRSWISISAISSR